MKRILLIDEERISVRGTLYLIETKVPNAEPFVSRTCSAGLQELKSNSYDVVVLDMMLPKGDWTIPVDRPDNLYGIELLTEIRRSFGDLPVICFTIIDNATIREKIMSLKAEYICKSSRDNRTELANAINHFLNKKR